MSFDTAIQALAEQLRPYVNQPGAAEARYSGSVTTNASSGQAEARDANGSYLHADDLSIDRAVVEQVLDAIAEQGLTDAGFNVVLLPDGNWQALLVHGEGLDLFIKPSLTLRPRPVEFVPPTQMPPADAELIARLWNGGAGYEAAPPATEAELAETEAQLGFPLPPGFRVLLGLANGAHAITPKDADVAEDGQDGADDEWPANLPTHGWILLSAEEIVGAYRRWAAWAVEDSPYHGIPLESATVGRTQDRILHPGWLPLVSDGSGNHVGMDLAPGPVGTLGQMICFGRDMEGAEVFSLSLEDWLAGKYVPNEEVPTEWLTTGAGESVDVAGLDPDLQVLRTFGDGQFDGSTLRLEQLRILALGLAQASLEGMVAPSLLEIVINGTQVDLSPLAGHPPIEEGVAVRRRHHRARGAHAAACTGRGQRRCAQRTPCTMGATGPLPRGHRRRHRPCPPAVEAQ